MFFVVSIWLLKGAIALLAAACVRRNRAVDNKWATRVQILVLGDLGRSPRMQYHALSAATNGAYVELIGYHQSQVYTDILEHERIKILPLTAAPEFLSTRKRGLFLLFGPLKVLYQVWALCKALYHDGQHARWMIVQNPPSIPTLAVAGLICRMRRTRLVIDWHNFGYTILALRLGAAHVLVTIARIYEWILGPYAFAHLCVTDAMSRVLQTKLGAQARILTLHDRPASIFQPFEQTQKSAFLDRLQDLLQSPRSGGIFSILRHPHHHIDHNAITTLIMHLKKHSTKLLVSATSWTPEEDFALLLDALVTYDNSLETDMDLGPDQLVVFITGKGPGRPAFEGRVLELQNSGLLARVTVMTGYFDDLEDYASLLASADLGISLHTSSSGLDLPMKVLDMFGAGLPVVGWSNFEAWPELVRQGQNGLGFGDAEELFDCLRTLLGPDARSLTKLRAGAISEGKQRWESQWIGVCGALLELDAVRVEKYGKA